MNHKNGMPPLLLPIRPPLGTIERAARKDGQRSAVREEGSREATWQETPFGGRKIPTERYSHECPIKGLTSGRGQR